MRKGPNDPGFSASFGSSSAIPIFFEVSGNVREAHNENLTQLILFAPVAGLAGKRRIT
jgi:hypothetical protein